MRKRFLFKPVFLVLIALVFAGCVKDKPVPVVPEKPFSEQYMIEVEAAANGNQVMIDIKKIIDINIDSSRDVCTIFQTHGLQITIIRCGDFLEIFLSKVEFHRG